MFCASCINQHMETHDSCPVCLTPLDKQSFQLSKFAQRQLGRIRIKCLYANNGCPWQGILSDKHNEEVRVTSKKKKTFYLNISYSVITSRVCVQMLEMDAQKH
jgi:hypothetical protein